MVIREVCVAADVLDCEYRVVRLRDGRHAFAWGLGDVTVGGTLPETAPRAERGVEVYATEREAEAAYRRCAEALAETDAAAAAELLAILDEVAH
jgi:hypothetical protein